ncbi:MAG: RidA family protein [Candidatus Dormibacteraeota bacterium]|nr:RidA family protein [Candidatus Dormibacteraeota bacterium]MBO0745801.1 RidA family protein [Candidatus Dormibacteraeota bacterium]
MDNEARVELVNPPQLGPPVGFSHAARAGNLVYTGGQIGCDAGGRVLAPGDLVAQFARALANVAVALRAAGCEPQDAIKLTYFVTDVPAYRAHLKKIGAAYREVFGRHYPATSLFGIQELFDPQALIEIECVAIRRAAPDPST